MQITNNRKADEDHQEQPGNESSSEQEECGANRRTDDWETFAKSLKTGAGRRAEENKKATIGDCLDGDVTTEVTELLDSVSPT